MLERFHDSKYQEKRPTYIGCSVAEEWHNFQIFAEVCNTIDITLGVDLRFEIRH